MRRLSPLLLAFALLGCPSELDFPDQVKDLRILAARADPPEVELPIDPVSPPVDVQVSVLVADPARGHVELRSRGCPEVDADACDNWVPEDDPERYPMPALYDPLRSTMARLADLPAAPALPGVTFDMTRTFPTPLLGDLLAQSTFGGLAGARPSLQFNVYSGEFQETGFKRIQVSFTDAFYRAALVGVGIEICEPASTLPTCEDGELPPDCCIEYLPRVANTNPVFEALGVRRESVDGVDGDITTVNPGDTLQVIINEQLRFFPVASDTSVEAYQSVGVDLEDESLFISDLEELLIFTWFTTEGGLFEFHRTEEEQNLGVDNLYTAPPTLGDHYIWIVLRDTRGGVDWRTVHISVQ